MPVQRLINAMEHPRLYQDQGKYAAAEPLFKRALEISEKALGPDHPDVAIDLTNLALLYQDQGKTELAKRFLQQGVQVEEQVLNLNLLGGSERQQQLYLQTFSRRTDGVVSFHLLAMPRDPEASQLALTTILQRKGRILDLLSGNQQQWLRQRLQPEDQALFDTLKAARRQLAILTFKQPEKLLLEQSRIEVEQLKAQIATREDQLSRRSAEFRTQNQSVTLAAVQSLIPASTALVEFVLYRPFDLKAPGNKRFGQPRYAAYILQPQGEPQGIDLGEANQINQAITAFRKTLGGSKAGMTGEDTVAETKRSARAVDRLLMKPIRDRLGSTRNLLLSPAGALNLLPFEALVDEHNRYLVETYAFTYLTSGRDLLRLQNTVASQQPPLLLADPYFDRPGEVVAQAPSDKPVGTRFIDLSQNSFPPLPGTEKEVNAIVPLLNSRYSGVRSLTGAQATKQVLEKIQAPTILHIATHGFFKAPPSQPTGAPAALVENPLLFSGLVLAGAKVQPPNPNDNGILTALEFTGINLLGTQLAVLSACDTGNGELSTGEGVYGLRRALVIAGSESQLFSLWRIDDNFTPTLMKSYYERLLAGDGRSEALRQTQLELLHSQQYSHPHYWASFIASGNWQPIKRNNVGLGL